MIRTYELTDEEYVAVTSALRNARDESIHPDASARYNETLRELIEQYESQDGQTAAEVGEDG